MSEQPINDGGPAFPLNDPLKSTGMTLRDYFAAAALQGMLANSKNYDSFDGYSDAAYEYADAMLERRKP
jgi:hypothetical protein